MISRARLAWLALLPLSAGTAAYAHPVTMWLAEGANNRVYLLGSVHLLRREDHPLPRVIETAYQDAEGLYMELDMDDIDARAVQETVNRLGMVDERSSLRELMGDDLYAEALAAADALDVPLDMLARTEPWYAAITVEQLVLTRIGFNPIYGVEMHLLNKATQDGKEILGFETIEQQLGLLDGLSLDAQRELLMQTLAEGAEMQGLMDGLINAWRTGDVDFLERNLLTDLANYPELYQTIVASRNRAWADTIGRLLASGDDYLVVVGALHLVGEDGVPRLLEHRGFTVRQMQEQESGAIAGQDLER